MNEEEPLFWMYVLISGIMWGGRSSIYICLITFLLISWICLTYQVVGRLAGSRFYNYRFLIMDRGCCPKSPQFASFILFCKTFWRVLPHIFQSGRVTSWSHTILDSSIWCLIPVLIFCCGRGGSLRLSSILCVQEDMGTGSLWSWYPILCIVILLREQGKDGTGCDNEDVSCISLPWHHRCSSVVTACIVISNIVIFTCGCPLKSILEWPQIWWRVSVWSLQWIYVSQRWINWTGDYYFIACPWSLPSTHWILLSNFPILLGVRNILRVAPGVLLVCHWSMLGMCQWLVSHIGERVFFQCTGTCLLHL